jgi:hypothetical protein
MVLNYPVGWPYQNPEHQFLISLYWNKAQKLENNKQKQLPLYCYESLILQTRCCSLYFPFTKHFKVPLANGYETQAKYRGKP